MADNGTPEPSGEVDAGIDGTSVSDTETSRLGAQACMDALRDMETVAGLTNTPDQTMEQYWQVRQATVDILLKAAGPTSPYLSGFVSVLAEYIDFTNTTGVPNLEAGGWEPKAAMTEAEFAARRQRMERIVGEVDHG